MVTGYKGQLANLRHTYIVEQSVASFTACIPSVIQKTCILTKF